MFSIGESAAPLRPRQALCAEATAAHTDRANEFDALHNVLEEVYTGNRARVSMDRFAGTVRDHIPFADWPGSIVQYMQTNPRAWRVTADCADERNQAQIATCVTEAVQAWLDACWETDSNASNSRSIPLGSSTSNPEGASSQGSASTPQPHRRPAAAQRRRPLGNAFGLRLGMDFARLIGSAVETTSASEGGVACHANALHSDLAQVSDYYGSCPYAPGSAIPIALRYAYFWGSFFLRLGAELTISPASRQENVRGSTIDDPRILNFDGDLQAGFGWTLSFADLLVSVGIRGGVQGADGDLRTNDGIVTQDDWRHGAFGGEVEAALLWSFGSYFYATIGAQLQIDFVSHANLHSATTNDTYRLSTPYHGFLFTINAAISFDITGYRDQ